MNNVKPLPLAMGETHHILALSGGKDSTALAIYMRDKVRQMKYVFCDTGYELKETYDYLKRVEAFLGKPITRLTPDGITFDDLLEMRNGFLPSPQVRWCTEHLKIKPYEKYIGDAKVISYVGIRSDESHRQGYISSKPNITSSFSEQCNTKKRIPLLAKDIRGFKGKVWRNCPGRNELRRLRQISNEGLNVKKRSIAMGSLREYSRILVTMAVTVARYANFRE